MSKSKAKQNWQLEITCTVRKSVYVENCTEEQAKDDPWSYVVGEHEMDMSDWEVTSIEPSE